MDAKSTMLNHLPDSAIRLISSTQVITSVYSVIKELLENSLDGGATSVDIKLDNFGLDRVEVRDNGCGIGAADVPVFAKRHFTSKISSHADLETLTTYGFRGEALASLCSVSEVSVTTKTSADDISLTYTLSNEGNIISTTPSHLGQGTTVCAKNLFKNLPVRKQYHSMMKKKKEDLKNVENLLVAYGIILPKIRLTLRHNKEMIWQKVVFDSTAAALQSTLGKAVMGQMEWTRKEVEEYEMKLELCLPKPGSDVLSLSRSSPERSFLCINDRPVSVKEINKLIRQYYSNCHACDMNRHPVYFLRITLPSRDVDVNVDPNKTTVMTANMSILKEQLEEMLLHIYGPLDQAPSWRYRSSEDEKDKLPSKTINDASSKVLEALKEIHTDPEGQSVSNLPAESNNGAEKGTKESLHSEPLVIFHQLTDGKKQTDTLRPDNMEESLSRNGHVKSTELTEVSCEAQSNSSVQENNTGCVSNGTAMDSHRDPSKAMQLDLDGNVLDEMLCSFPSSNVANSVEQLAKKTAEAVSASEISMLSGRGASLNINRNEWADRCKDLPTVSSEGVKALDGGEKAARSGSGSGSSREEEGQVAGPSGWSHGTSVRSACGAVVQPVQLLAPSPAHHPGKRPLSPSASQHQEQKQGAPPEKRGRRLCPAQSTLYDMINNTAVKRPLSARDIFMKEKRSSVVEQHADADYDEVTDILANMWQDLGDEELIVFREKCWLDTQRYNKEVANAKKVSEKTKASTSSKVKPQMSMRDLVAEASTQPSQKPMAMGTAHCYVSESEMPFSMAALKNCLHHSAPCSCQVHFSSPKVLASLTSCKAWVCAKNGELCILNVHRLSEAIVYCRLLKQHRLSVHHCQPVHLTPSNTDGCWSVLEHLAGDQVSLTSFTHLSDERIIANGFDVKCWKDADSKLCAELVGVCGDIPTYNVKDLLEVLQLIGDNSSLSLAQCRPLKAVNHLKGEAVRMVRQQAGSRSLEDVQNLLEEGAAFLPADCTSCLHDRPFFHTLLPDIDGATSSQTSLDSQQLDETGCSSSGRMREGSSGGNCAEEEPGSGRSGSHSAGAADNNDNSLDQVMSLDDLMDFD